jgi:hypothetical protein
MPGASLHPLLPGLKARVSALCQYGKSHRNGPNAGANFQGISFMLG